MNSQARILLIDKATDRKQRINALKGRGYAVFPALNMEEARSRCMRGGYDLIVVNADGDGEKASQFCDDIRRQCPRQQVILCADGSSGQREGAVAADVESVVKAVESTLGGGQQANLASAA